MTPLPKQPWYLRAVDRFIPDKPSFEDVSERRRTRLTLGVILTQFPLLLAVQLYFNVAHFSATETTRPSRLPRVASTPR